MRHDEGYFSAKDGTRLFWRSDLPDAAPRAFIGIVHGYGDHSARYEWTIGELVRAGFGVLAFDYRGHGRADGRRGDCLRWDDFIDDLNVFWARLETQANGAPIFLLAHSHGALISTHWATRPPAALKGIVMTAPFYELAFAPPALKLFAASIIKLVLPGIHLGNELKVEDLSRDPAWQAESAKDPLYFHVTTPRWFFGCKDAQQRLAGLGGSLSTPLFVLAGTADRIASMPAVRAFFDTVGSKDKTWKDYDDFRHEVLNEQNKERALSDIVAWISAHL